MNSEGEIGGNALEALWMDAGAEALELLAERAALEQRWRTDLECEWAENGGTWRSAAEGDQR